MTLFGSSPALAAEVSFVMGTVVRPELINEGDEIPPGTVIETGADGMVMIHHQWPSDIPSRDCVLLAIFGYGQSYTVSQDATPGRCETTVPSNPADLAPGRPFLARETRYGDAKFDDPSVPDRVRASVASWQAFDAWVTRADRAYSGTVSAVGSGTISVRAGSGPARTFTIDPNTVSSPVRVIELLNRRVRLDYRQAGTRLQVLRVHLLSAAGPQVIGPAIVGGERARGRGPSRPPVPGRGGSQTPPTPAPTASEAWGCSLDLHQGDTGTLVLARTGEAIRGKTAIVRGPQEHEIAGTWIGEVVRFDRILSPTSRQVFVGIAEPISRTEIRMAGRFAAGFQGTWSADCRRSD
jgi:hypothetical protein